MAHWQKIKWVIFPFYVQIAHGARPSQSLYQEDTFDSSDKF